MTNLWVMLSVFLAVLSLGFTGILKLLFCVLTVIIGSFTVLYAISSSKEFSESFIRRIRCSKQISSAFPPMLKSFRPDTVRNPENFLTGYAPVDLELKEILDFIFRDFVFPWQILLTHTNDFSREVREIAEIVISNLSEKVKEVDWIHFGTTRMVNDIASHVRLFKKSRLSMKTKNFENSNSNFESSTSLPIKNPSLFESSSSSTLSTNKNSGMLIDLESAFFDEESKVNPSICRDLVSTIHQEEINFLQEISEILLFLLLPSKDFGCLSLRTLTRELLVNVVLKPVLDLISDPDFLNQNIVWLYKDYPIKPDQLTITIRYSESLDELQSTRDFVCKQIAFLRSNDSKSELDSSLKQQLNSLIYLRKTIDNRIHRLQTGSETDSLGLPAQVDWNQMIGPGLKLFELPLDVVLKNNLALSYFIDYMTSIGCQCYIFFFLNIEGWRASTEQQSQASNSISGSENLQQQQQQLKSFSSSNFENMRESAYSIYEEYLSDKANPRLKIEDSAIKRLLFKIRTEPPEPEWFTEVQTLVFQKLETDDRFLDSFKRSMGYVKLLAELDLLRDPTAKDPEEDTASLGDEFSIYDTLSLTSIDDVDSSKSCEEGMNFSLSSKEDLNCTLTTSTNEGSNHLEVKDNPKSHRRMGSGSLNVNRPLTKTHHRNASHGSICSSTSQTLPILEAEIVSYHCVKNSGKSYATYKLFVTKRSPSRMQGEEDRRAIFRRYSDFHDLHEKVVTKFPSLSNLPFPKKKAFGNMVNNVLEQRKKMLHMYMQELLKTQTLEQNPDLLAILSFFLDDRNFVGKNLTNPNQVQVAAKAVVGSVRSSVKTVSNSVKNVSNVVTAVPGQLLNTVDNVVDGIISKVLISKPNYEKSVIESKVDLESGQDNIPLRIALLFLDEVFDLKERNQWLRRQIVAILRQILKAMFGDWANRRIIDYFTQLTSSTLLSIYLKSFKDSIWPDGRPAAEKPTRDEDTKNRARVAAKMALFSSLPDELRRIIGSETSRTGIMMLFEMLQHPVLNKRLSIVLLEGILDTLFRSHNFPAIFAQLYSRSGRVRNELKNSQRKRNDLRR